LARNLVTPFVFERAPSFAICPSCGRVFWPGTHFQDMDRKVDQILRPRQKRRRFGPETKKNLRGGRKE